MADEKKTYLLNVESNLEEYIAEAAKAADELAKFKAAWDGVRKSEKASNEEKEKAKAQFQAANAEYKTASNLVTSFQKALNSESNSRKQLNEILKLQMYHSGKLKNAMIDEGDGIMKLNPQYIKLRENIEKTKSSILEYDASIKDGRSNVGNYTDSIKAAVGEMNMLPGAAGQAVSSIQRIGVALKALALNPVVLALSAIVGAIALLVKAFKNSQPLMDAFNKVSAAIGATFKVLLDRVSNFVEFLGGIFNKELRESRKEAKALNDELIGIEETMTRREKRELRRANRKGLIEEIREEAAAAYELADAEQALEDEEIKFIQRKAEMQRQIEELRLSTRDETLTNEERLANLDKAIALTQELTDQEVAFAKERARISQEQVDQGNSTREELRQNEELQAAAAEREAQGLKEMKRMASERLTLINQINKAESDAAKARIDRAEKEVEAQKAKLQKEIEDYYKWIEAQKQADEKAAADKRQRQLEEAEWERQQFLINQENILAIRQANNDNIFAIERERLRLQQEEEIRSAVETGANINLINEKYKAAQIQLTKEEQDAKAAIYGSFASNIAQLFGENTAIGRIAAATAATIDTYRGAVAAFAQTPGGIVVKTLAATAATIAGLASVKKILATKSGLPGDSGGGTAPAPTTIISTPVAQRAFATPTTTLVQPTLTQSQLNAVPTSNPATAEEIAEAIRKIPAPVVTVEDINARTAEAKKVEVRAVI